ncbi:Crp/Fnr family transcriptional regulator [Candidatus Magnetobacterium bavaricum]|uniref:Crp/Fnr family transcriptional regulator n=1 Tax=Candidatus Magnetobacterium bavaricum TaxID=29290 RepID=A0A0F3GWX3_9BACT|nr:Crp/Fnr family transcriptional regulator [Candidatus Magnetobacterium bavaricum]
MKIDSGKYLRIIAKIPIFASLTEAELEQLMDKIHVRKVKKNHVILGQEYTNKYMYIILNGAAKITTQTEDGKEIILAIRKTGEYFGEISLIDGQTSVAAVKATKNSVVAIISRENFHFMLDSYPKVVKSLLIELTRTLRSAIATIHLFSHNKVEQRLKILFMQFANEHGQENKGGVTLNMELNRQKIADMIGCSRQSVSEVMSLMRDKEYLSITSENKIHLTPKFFKL